MPAWPQMNSTQTIKAYTSAADTLDRLPFWHHFGRRTVERLALAPGARVLDLCCGTGASAIPAAGAVGPSGTVVGVDITEALLVQARARAAAASLAHATFVNSAVETLRFAPASFDAVVSVFGLFFIEDMAALLARAWTWLRPGGVLAITSWGQTVLSPGEALFREAVLAENPSFAQSNHAERLATPGKMAAVFAEAGLPAPQVELERWEMPLAAPEEFWPVILGTSNRAALDGLPSAARERVRASVIGALRAREVRATTMEALYAVARHG